MSTDTFYCTTCGKTKPASDARSVEVKRGRGFARVKRCVGCVNLAKLPRKQRQEASDKARLEAAQALSYAKATGVEAPDV